MVPILAIRLLGPPDLIWEEQPICILRRQTRMLLYRLALQEQAVPREHLCFLFWPDVSEFIAGRNLSHLLTHLRQALPSDHILIAEDDRVQLNSEFIWCDTQEFARLCDLTQAEDDPEWLIRAVELYRGPFLDGVSPVTSPEFEAWMMLERRIWERRYLENMAALVDRLIRAGDYTRAIAYGHRYLTTERLDEAMHRRLIELYAMRGDRAAVLRQYSLCATLLERELGVTPLPETLAVYEAVLRGQPSRQMPASDRTQWTTLPGPHVPLVGRQMTLDQLQRAWTRTCTGKGGVLLLAGEAGIGKSRLLQHFVTHLQNQALTWVAAGQPGMQTLPYYLLIQALRSHSSTGPHATQAAPLGSPYRYSEWWLSEVARLLPELAPPGQHEAGGLVMPPEEARLRLFEGLRRYLQSLLAGGRPGVLCLDNLHWADSVTLDWLVYLSPYLAALPLLVVGAYRSDVTETLADLRHAFSRLGLLTEIELEGLGRQEVAQLVHHLCGHADAGSVFVERLHSGTGGNPFFILQVAQALVESGQHPQQWAILDDFPLPKSIRAAVDTRIASLDATTRQVIEACAILAPSFTFDLVRLTSGRRDLETLDSLDDLVQRRLLDSNGPDYSFHHDLVRRVVEGRVSETRRRLLHRRAGRALEQLNRHAVATLAYHYEAGDELDKAVHFHELAAQRAEAIFAWREAEEHRGRIRALQLN